MRRPVFTRRGDARWTGRDTMDDGLLDGRRPRPEGVRPVPSEPPSTGPEVRPACPHASQARRGARRMAVPHLAAPLPGVRHDRAPPRAAERPLHADPSSRAGGARVPAPQASAPEPRSRIVDNAVYSEGRRVATPATAAESREELAAGEDRLVWLGLYRPEPQELGELAELYDLPELAVEDAIKAHQRPKFERYGDTLFVVLKAARYLDATEEVEFGELHLFLGADFAITVRHSESPDLSRVRRRLESEPALLAKGSEAVLYATLDAVVDGYRPVVDGLATDIDEIETEVFRGDPGVSRRIYELSQEVLEFQRAAAPLTGILARSPRASTSTASTRSCAATCATSPTTSRR